MPRPSFPNAPTVGIPMDFNIEDEESLPTNQQVFVNLKDEGGNRRLSAS